MNSRRKYNKLLLALGAALLFGLSAVLAGLLQSGQSQARSALFATVKKNEQRPDHPDGAARFRRLQMQDEKGFVPPDGFEKARRHVGLMRLAQQERSNKGITIQSAGIKPDSWTWMGPSNVGGRIRAIVIQPTNANNMWVGSVGGGIWRTTDAGGNWQPVNDFMANLAVSTMVINPANTNIMYAGTGEIFTGGFNNPGNGFSPDGLLGAGIFRSTDAGVTWTQLPNTNPGNTAVCPPPATPANCPWLYVNRLAISRNGDTILAATGNGIQRSTDRGTTWTPSICPPAPCTPPACPPAPCTAQAFDIDFHPTVVFGSCVAHFCLERRFFRYRFTNVPFLSALTRVTSTATKSDPKEMTAIIEISSPTGEAETSRPEAT